MAKQTLETVQRALQGEWPSIESRDINHGTQFTLPEGTKVNFFQSTGKVMVQGKDSDEKKRAEHLLNAASKILPATAAGTQQPLSLIQPEKIFIVYGHDTEAREQLELLLRRLKFEPVILANMVAEGQTIIEMLEKHRLGVKYACVLLTPDDEGHKLDCPKEKKPRARQNVVLELGMFLSTLGRKRVAILHKGDVELPSDIHGLVYIPFKKHVSEVKPRLAAELQEAGFQINIKDMLAS
jgi:predicted nucleotide-binding protein